MFFDITKSLKSLFFGHKVIMKHLFKKYSASAYQKENIEFSNNFRGKILVLKDKNDKLLCIGCGLCKNVCPCNEVIKIEKQSEDNGKLHIRYQRNEAQCIYCGNCVENCPQNALKFTNDFDLATGIKSELRNIV